jgi:ketosteroid isomerase-like protein
MATIQLPKAIQAFIDATNARDSDAFVAAFTDDAYLNDWGREFHGHEGVRSWDGTDNIGVNAHFELVDAEAGDAPDSYVVTLTVSGDGYNGTGPMSFELRGNRIARLVIS